MLFIEVTNGIVSRIVSAGSDAEHVMIWDCVSGHPATPYMLPVEKIIPRGIGIPQFFPIRRTERETPETP